MTRDQARDLWLSTLRTREIGADAASQGELHASWERAGLSSSDRAPLQEALRVDGDLARREALVRATRRLILGRGFDVDLLTTPAARMRGL